MIRTMFDFAGRRRKLAALVEGRPALVRAARETFRNADTAFPFRQDSDFYYLTGFPEPDAAAWLCGDEYILFVKPRDPGREPWEGAREGVEEAARYGARARPLAELEKFLSEAPVFVDAKPLIARMRLVKDAEEISVMERAARISRAAHEKARAVALPGRFEYEVEAEINYHFRKPGASGPAYPTIVASGANATTLHYTKNSRRIEDGDLVLIDAGAECDLYASDITRTFAASGKLTPGQEAIFEVVSQARKSAIALCIPGSSMEDVHRASQQVLANGLVELGVIEGPVARALEEKRHLSYTLHKTGHWLGLDVHDCRALPAEENPELTAGMVLTVEPGLYFRPDTPAPREWKGIGVRIEDDILVTAQGPRILSQ